MSTRSRRCGWGGGASTRGIGLRAGWPSWGGCCTRRGGRARCLTRGGGWGIWRRCIGLVGGSGRGGRAVIFGWSECASLVCVCEVRVRGLARCVVGMLWAGWAGGVFAPLLARIMGRWRLRFRNGAFTARGRNGGWANTEAIWDSTTR